MLYAPLTVQSGDLCYQSSPQWPVHRKKRHFNFESYAHRQSDTSLFKIDTSTTSGMCNFYIDCFKTKCFWLDGRSRMANQLFWAPPCNFHSACLSLFTGLALCTTTTIQSCIVNLRAALYHRWLSEFNAPVGYQEVAGHTYKWLLLIG